MGTNQYGSYDIDVLMVGDDGQTATGYNAATGDLFVLTAKVPLMLVGFCGLVTTAYTVPQTAQVVSLDIRPNFGSDTGRVEKKAVTMNAARPAGTVIRALFEGVKLLPGQQAVIEQKVQGANGAGAAKWYFLGYPIPESAGNCPNLVDV